MANLNFLKTAQVYFDPDPIAGSDVKRMPVQNLSFSQTFTDNVYSNRTLHDNANFFEQSNIKKANPVNFEFTINMVEEDNLDGVLDCLVNLTSSNTLKPFTLYFMDSQHNNLQYLLLDCVFTSGTFVIEKLAPLALTLTGQAPKLVELNSFSASAYKGSFESQLDNVTYQNTKAVEVIVDGTNITEGVVALTIELQNDITWTPYQTVNDALSVTDESNTMYPSNFTLEKRTLAGSITRYIKADSASINEDTDTDTWQTGKGISIKAGNSLTNGFQLVLDNCTFTNRINPGTIFTSVYDWRMNDNPASLGDKIKLRTS